MCCTGVAMIFVGATYQDDISTYLIVGGIFVIILYLLPLLVVLAYIKETGNGVRGNSIMEGLRNSIIIVSTLSFILPLFIPLLLVCLGILLIWGTIVVIIASGNVRDHPLKMSAFFRGGGVKNLPNLPMDSSKKLPTVGVKNCEKFANVLNGRSLIS